MTDETLTPITFTLPAGRYVAHAVAVVVSFDADGRHYLNYNTLGEPPAWVQVALFTAAAERAKEQMSSMWEG
jgi:hypothetical protein